MQSIPWLELKHLPKRNPKLRVLVFSPQYPEDDPMRYRIMGVQFIRHCTDVERFAYITTPIGYD